ncbi:hypothetical protein OG474_11580 [Kribbella sp. NBC_01505]|uniref:hypothetical protein n=1 Tax=Kribbella sp. NBC_01505 TaxID=2903580 RepID=UPI00386E60DF
MSEHAVIIQIALGEDHFGSAEAREVVRVLEREIRAVVDGSGLGEFDGDEFGGGEAVLYLYGPDADKLYAAVEPALQALPLRPVQVTRRYGDAGDPAALERRIQLE